MKCYLGTQGAWLEKPNLQLQRCNPSATFWAAVGGLAQLNKFRYASKKDGTQHHLRCRGLFVLCGFGTVASRISCYLGMSTCELLLAPLRYAYLHHPEGFAVQHSCVFASPRPPCSYGQLCIRNDIIVNLSINLDKPNTGGQQHSFYLPGHRCKGNRRARRGPGPCVWPPEVPTRLLAVQYQYLENREWEEGVAFGRCPRCAAQGLVRGYSLEIERIRLKSK